MIMRSVGAGLVAVGVVGILGHAMAIPALSALAPALIGAVMVSGSVFLAGGVIAGKLADLLTAAGVGDDLS